ncbi:MAG: FAD-dependent oxidoreductase [Cyanobacteria bacterium J06598_3]
MKKHIVIIGAGPAGAATALLLAQQGMQVTLIEKETAFERVFRGEGLMPAGLEALHQIGLKTVFETLPSRQLTSWDFYVGGQRRMRVLEPEQKGLATQIMDQGSLLRAMVEKAKSLPGFTFQAGWQVTELMRDKQNAVVGVRATANGESREFVADAVIACDGRYSRVRKLAGLELSNSPAQFDVLWFKLPAPKALSTETPFIACLQPGTQFAFYPSWDGQLQIGWIVEKSAHKKGGLAKLKERDWIEAFAQALPPVFAKHFRQHKDSLEGPIYLDVQVGCCPQWSIPGLLLLGDAAHPMAPNRAQGINMALRDAIVVANHLSAIDDRPITADTLAAIQSERQPEIEAVQKMQLAEWQKVELISTPGVPYWGFKAIASTFGRFKFAQNIWLHEQKGLREGVLPVQLQSENYSVK